MQQQEQHANLMLAGGAAENGSSMVGGHSPARPSSSLLDDDDDDDDNNISGVAYEGRLLSGPDSLTTGNNVTAASMWRPQGGVKASSSAVTSSTLAPSPPLPQSTKPQVSFAALPNPHHRLGGSTSDSVEIDHVNANSNDNDDWADDSKLPAASSASENPGATTTTSVVSTSDVDEAKAYARALLSLCDANSATPVDPDTLVMLLTMCTSARDTVNQTIQSALTGGHDSIEDLLQLNEHLSYAIAMGEKVRGVLDNNTSSSRSTDLAAASSSEQLLLHTPMSSPLSSKGLVGQDRTESIASLPHVLPTPATRQQSSTTLNVETMVEKGDIFSLICMLRAQQAERRLDAAHALMEFARDDGAASTRRHEIQSSGGLQSLLTLFRVHDTPNETKVVVSLAVAYLLPEVDKISITQGLQIVECLRLLSRAKKITPNGQVITEDECRKSSVKGLLMFWMNLLFPRLADVNKVADHQKGSQNHSLMVRSSSGANRWRSSRASASGGGHFDQRRDLIELQELLDVTVSLIVSAASPSPDRPTLDEALTLVEAVCAVEVARPIAVREGILRTLVVWIKSKDTEKIRPATSALRHLTSINDSYMAGWIHSQIVNEGILGNLVQSIQVLDGGVGNDEQLAVAQILSSLCVAPHTRAAVADPNGNGISLLIQFLVEASTESRYYAGSALLQLASAAITRSTVFGDDSFELAQTNKAVEYVSLWE